MSILEDTQTLASLFLLPENIAVEAVYPTKSRLTLQISCTQKSAFHSSEGTSNEFNRTGAEASDQRISARGSGYTRFVALISRMMVPLLTNLHSHFGPCTGISFIDSTSLKVCDRKRINQHRVFAADAKRGKASMGWFYGFKLHLAVNDQGGLLACCLTPGNVDDRKPVPSMVKKLRGKLFGDRGYISASLSEVIAVAFF